MLGIAVSPLRLILIGSSLITMWLAIRHRSLIAAHGSAGCLALAAMGTSVESIDLQALRMLRWMLTTLRRLIPDTITQWGIVAIAAAFLLLGVGAIVSLKTAPPPRTESII
jgi:hypothetical protein